MFSCSLEKTPNSEKKNPFYDFYENPDLLAVRYIIYTLFIIIFPRDPCVLPSSLHSEKPNVVRAL